MKFNLLKSMLYVTTAMGAYCLTAASASAQTAGPNASDNNKSAGADENAIEEIVVTGTSIRGVAPVGANVTGLSNEDIQATLSENTQQILTNLPQGSSFNNLAQTLPAAGNFAGQTRVPIAQPNLRNLPGCNGSGTGACTLVLIDGHRITPEGIQQQAVDPAVIPPGMIDHVEVILDGNSAIYGSDAVGGVINFITKRNFNGVTADANYGFAPGGYTTYSADVTAGQSWDTGSIMVSYSHGYHDALFGSERSYVKSINWATGQPYSTTCDLSNVTVGTKNYAWPALGLGQNTCDLSKNQTIYPSETRNNGYLVFSQQIGQRIRFELSGFYSDSSQTGTAGALTNAVGGGITVGVGASNPYYTPVPGVAGTPNQSVQFSLGPVFGERSATQGTRIQTGQVTPTLTVELGGSWELRTLFTYGRSITSYDDPFANPNTIALAASATTLATAIDPYNIAATKNTALFGSLEYDNRGNGVNKYTNVRSIADGKLFALPGGDVHAAAGVEYYNDFFSSQTTNPTTTLIVPAIGASQHADSAFVETYIPLVGQGNSLPGVSRLELSASGRYDKYPGLGGQFDPKLALVYAPIEWIKIRGSWGKSFDAPTSTDKARALSQLQTIGFVPLSPALAGIFTPAGTFFPPGLNGLIFLTGTNPALQPQSSTNWAIGTDVTPPVVPHLTLSGTYYHILFKDIIGLPTVNGNQAPLFNNYPNLYVYNSAGIPTAQLNAIASQAPLSGPAAVAQATGAGYRIIEYIDGRVTNLGLATIAGIDFSAGYSMPTSFGGLDARFTGNYQLENDTRYAPSASPVNQNYALGAPDLNYSLVVGANIQKLRAQVTWNHTSGYAFSPIQTGISPSVQTHVDAYDAVNLFFLYGFDGPGLAKGLSLTFGVTNVFDADPPVYKLNSGNGFPPTIRTLGRVTQFGISKQF